MLRRVFIIVGLAPGLLFGGGTPSTAGADLEADESSSEEFDQTPDQLTWQLLVTSYYMFNAHRVSGPYNALEDPYADSAGFGLTFAGGDVAYRTDKWGLTINLRWGQNVDRLTELAPLSRGFATWIPCEKLTLDLGYFAAFVGIETADEWQNATFTRGIVYFRIQPFRHLGLRALIEPHENVDITVIVARGSIFGTSFPTDVRASVVAPTVGAQIRYTPSTATDLRLGAVAGPNGSNGNRNWQATIDFIAQWTPDAWTLFVDGDYQFSPRGSLTGLDVSKQWGVSLGGSYDIGDHWAVGLRGEYFGASDGSESGTEFTVTGTVRYLPVEYLIISLEPRAEFAANDIYFSRPFVTDPMTGDTVPSLNQDWFFGFWIGVTARLGN
ncbi:MAG: outer membrane beta-barrel protein [Polyangiales bacterium]